MKTIKCKFTFEECEKKLKEEIKKSGATLFFEIDHKKNAEEVGLKLNKCKVFYFGNPKVGTILMQKNISIAYELPLRVALWEEGGETYVGYKLPSEIAEEYKVEADIVKKMDDFMSNIIGVLIS
ncbi:MAG: DUF302 domain-containing protein [Sulfolobus sp.]|nr:DUF302 domain-containing protein [Sulfolobus sp.]